MAEKLRSVSSVPAGGAVSSEAGQPVGGKSASRVLHMLSVFQGATGPLGLTELARRAGLPKSTAFRLLATLESSGYLVRSGADYMLSGHLLELGHQARAVRHGNAVERVYPYLCELFASSRVTASYATMFRERALLIESVGSLLRERTESVAATVALAKQSGACLSSAELGDRGVSLLGASLAGALPVFAAPSPVFEGVFDVAVAVQPVGEQPGSFVMSTSHRSQVLGLSSLLRSAAEHFEKSQRSAEKPVHVA